ncbi:MAG: hypothetical protein EXS59_02315 [Candidatus Taylorbacteria bacterium]|nr:hypothetical protein [Candidatus Taylorbacteria bacterium]
MFQTIEQALELYRSKLRELKDWKVSRTRLSGRGEPTVHAVQPGESSYLSHAETTLKVMEETLGLNKEEIAQIHAEVGMIKTSSFHALDCGEVGRLKWTM